MDSVVAKRLASELKGKSINQWELVEYIDHGKSALVFKGACREQEAAVKVFDPGLIARFNKETQIERIKRELSLKNKKHDNLVKILDGGECCETGYLYVAMEYINAPNLEKVIKEIPRDNIRRIIKQVACAALFLENLGLCHRDIKPSNVAITKDLKTAILLDLGVLKPIGISDLTDEVAEHFVGTLRYSPPEFLLREEEDTIEGWRAVTFYQIGALLHDLIMLTPIFEEYTDPYTRLVKAVEKTIPKIDAHDIDDDLIHLANLCLTKDPKLRLKMLDWKDFFKESRGRGSIEEIRGRIEQRCEMVQTNGGENNYVAEEQLNRKCENRIMQILDEVEMFVRSECVPQKIFPPIKISKHLSGSNSQNQLFVTFEPSSSKQLHNSLCIIVDIETIDPSNDATLINYCVMLYSKSDVATQIGWDKYRNLYKGTYEKEAVTNVVKKLLYYAFDKAQQKDALEDSCKIFIEPFEE